jgi:hypothetical protein
VEYLNDAARVAVRHAGRTMLKKGPRTLHDVHELWMTLVQL